MTTDEVIAYVRSLDSTYDAIQFLYIQRPGRSLAAMASLIQTRVERPNLSYEDLQKLCLTAIRDGETGYRSFLATRKEGDQSPLATS